MASSSSRPAANGNGHSARSREPVLTPSTINQSVLKVSYAVRGELALKADEYAQKLASSGKGGPDKNHTSSSSLPFDRVVTANIGNPQQKGLDQKPLTYWRQVISLAEYPELMEEPLLEHTTKIYPEDALEKARSLHEELGSTGAYTHSKGLLAIRKRVAKFIEERDGYPSDPESIYLTAGASAGVSTLLGLALQPGDGCLIPIPQYPLYTATLAHIDGVALPYYLDESNDWSMSHKILLDGIAKAKSDGVRAKALVIINPGNPTGACLTREAMEQVVQLCYDERLVLMADEVYQNNIFNPETKPFVSFKKVLRSMSKEVAESVELVSFHSTSKGVTGECGRRGGYFEAVNISENVMEQVYKMASVNLCPPVSGQIGVDLLVSPPKPGSPSWKQYEAETSTIHNNLRSRSQYMYERFNALPGMSCAKPDGAMYLFPRFEIPPKAIEEAKKKGKEPDVMYALDLLDATGICAVAGSGFGQEEKTFHMRVTALCPGVEEYVGKIEQFHKDFLKKYE